jgi:hypothetical protein
VASAPARLKDGPVQITLFAQVRSGQLLQPGINAIEAVNKINENIPPLLMSFLRDQAGRPAE